MNMAHIAKGFGVDGEVVHSAEQLRAALARARKATVEGKPYLIDAQVARVGVAWAEKPWIPPHPHRPGAHAQRSEGSIIFPAISRRGCSMSTQGNAPVTGAKEALTQEFNGKPLTATRYSATRGRTTW